MKIILKYSFITLLVFLLVLILTNPSENKFLKSVSEDYGHMHTGVSMDSKILKHIGNSNRTSYLIYSKYEYRFQGISVFYMGILNRVIYLGNDFEPSTIKQEQETIEI